MITRPFVYLLLCGFVAYAFIYVFFVVFIFVAIVVVDGVWWWLLVVVGGIVHLLPPVPVAGRQLDSGTQTNKQIGHSVLKYLDEKHRILEDIVKSLTPPLKNH